MPRKSRAESNAAVARWKAAHPERVKEWSKRYVERRAANRKAEKEQRARLLASAARMVERARVLAAEAMQRAA